MRGRNKMRAALSLLAVFAVALAGIGQATAAGLQDDATLFLDQYGVPTLQGTSEHDVIFLQGYFHAKNRLFQMDFQRKLFSGRSAEMVGSAALPTDIQLRTLGLRRAAERSLAVQTPEVLEWLQAYSDGINSYLEGPGPLPAEYGALELDASSIEPWTPLDSLTLVKGLSFGLSFDLSDIDRTVAFLNFLGVCEATGCNGKQLTDDDLYRVAPFEATLSIPPPPPPPGSESASEPEAPVDEQLPEYISRPGFRDMLMDYVDTIKDIPMLNNKLKNEHTDEGSNWWVIAGANSETGNPLIANDPHLALDAPATFFEVHLNVIDGINVTGISFPGAPGIVQGCNDTVCWGSTVNPMDVTDVYQEVLQALDPNNPTLPTHSVFDGQIEPLQFIPQTYFTNVIGNGVPNTIVDAGIPSDQGGLTLIVPRRNNGPIVQTSFDPTSPTPLTGVSVMYTGWSGTQDLEAFRLFARASSMQDFKDALQFFDVGSQNWGYADINGNIAYYTSAELPIREDLQTLFFPAGLQWPGLIRDGTHTEPHEWMPVLNPQPNQSVPYEILPFAEMPQTENPAAGYILNANNDPIGTTFDNVAWNQFRAGFNGNLYLSSGYATGYRMARIQQLVNDVLAGGGKMSQAESIAIQGNNQLLDAERLTPFILDAWDNATAPGAAPELGPLAADPRLAEAVSRLAAWQFDTPTGITEGYDPGDTPGALDPPTDGEVDASVAATVYSMWRGQFVQRVIDSTLANWPVPLDEWAPGSANAMKAVRRLLDRYPLSGGFGASLINFFSVPGVADQDVARDIIILESLQQALDLAASPDFGPAFGESTSQDDYRWGMLHRVVFDSVLGGPFSIPPAGSPDNLSPDLPGFSRAGGMGAVDASSHSARADGLHEFMFGSGPNRRLIAEMTPQGPEVLQVIPGGQDGNVGSPNQADQLPLWLTNNYKPLPVSMDEVAAMAVETVSFRCDNGVVDPGEQCDDANLDENDGCNQACRLAPIITCIDPVVAASDDTCTADPECTVIASCTDAGGSVVSLVCDHGGSLGLGPAESDVTCTDAEGIDQTLLRCALNVTDQTPPTLDFDLSSDILWPPNHRQVGITTTSTASDACGPTTIILQDIVSNEADDAPGLADGDTTNDIQNADLGVEDFAFDLRAERASNALGRTYTVTYTAIDEAGNETSDSRTVDVPIDVGGTTDPMYLVLEHATGGTAVVWNPVDDAQAFNVIRSRLENGARLNETYTLGPVFCVEHRSPDENTYGDEDIVDPEPGKGFSYLVEYIDLGGARSSYGSDSAPYPRVPQSGDCE